MAEAVAARQPAVAQRADPQRSVVQGSRQRAPTARPGISELQRSLGNRGMAQFLRASGIQPKLTVGPADDEYEREADRVADEVMRMPDPAGVTAQRSTLRVQRMCAECGEEEREEVQRAPIGIQRMCAACEAKKRQREPSHISRKCASCEEAEEEHAVQAKFGAGGPGEASSDLDTYVTGARGGGAPLPPSTRAYFEDRFGHDFGGVRVHTGARSVQAAAGINALAFATGSDIHFGSGRFQPGTPHGDRLLAHELTHVVQQTSAGGRTVRRAPRRIQKLGDLSKRPAALDLRCPVPPGSPHPVADFIEFGNRVTALTPLDVAKIENVVMNWHAAGTNQTVRVDGFASRPGRDELNWELSCARA